MESLRKRALKSVFWTGIQQFSTSGVSFIVSIILARLLLPKEFALIAMTALFLEVGRTLRDSGLASSLIRTVNPDDEDYSTVFYFNLAVSILIYIILYFLAPFIADFYNQPILTKLVRVLSLKVIFGAFSSIQMTQLTKVMDFRTQLFINLPALAISSTVGIYMAYNGYGVWSLACMTIVQSIITCVILWIYSGWRPLLSFSQSKFKYHFNFGNKLAVASLLNTLFKNIYPVIIGKFYHASILGYYSRAESLRNFPITSLSAVLNKVTYPLFAEIQNSDIRLKSTYKSIMQLSMFIVSPILILMIALAYPLFELVLTSKWLSAVPYFQILCLAGLFRPISAYNLNILNVKGKSSLRLRLSILKRSLTIIFVIAGFQFGIFGLLIAQLINSLVGLYINCHHSGKLINYRFIEQIKDIYMFVIISSISGFLVYFIDVTFFDMNSFFVRLLSGVILGSFSYILLNFITQPQFLYDLRKIQS